MKWIYTGITLIILCLEVSAQQDYFVFIQENTRQTFYVRIGEHTYSSSAEGHLILSPMRDSIYSIYIGFPKIRYPEQLFSVAIGKRDRGFELQRVYGKWQLYDLQKGELLTPNEVSTQNQAGTRRTDSYSQLMAGVVNDSAVLYVSPADEGVVKGDSILADTSSKVAVVVDTAAEEIVSGNTTAEEPVAHDTISDLTVSDDSTSGEPVVAVSAEKVTNKKDTAVKKEVVKEAQTVMEAAPADSGSATPGSVRDKRDIIRYLTENVVDGKLLIYLDRTGPVTDTIRIIIPRL